MNSDKIFSIEHVKLFDEYHRKAQMLRHEHKNRTDYKMEMVKIWSESDWQEYRDMAKKFEKDIKELWDDYEIKLNLLLKGE